MLAMEVDKGPAAGGGGISADQPPPGASTAGAQDAAENHGGNDGNGTTNPDPALDPYGTEVKPESDDEGLMEREERHLRRLEAQEQEQNEQDGNDGAENEQGGDVGTGNTLDGHTNAAEDDEEAEGYAAILDPLHGYSCPEPDYATANLLGTMSIIELISKCVPVLDEIVDAIMVWIVPFMSILGTQSTMGLVNLDASGTERDGANVDYVDEDGRRQLSVASGTLLFLQIILILFGICLALSMHLTTRFVRMIGVESDGSPAYSPSRGNLDSNHCYHGHIHSAAGNCPDHRDWRDYNRCEAKVVGQTSY